MRQMQMDEPALRALLQSVATPHAHHAHAARRMSRRGFLGGAAGAAGALAGAGLLSPIGGLAKQAGG